MPKSKKTKNSQINEEVLSKIINEATSKLVDGLEKIYQERKDNVKAQKDQ